MYAINYDEWGFPLAISRDGYWLIWLNPCERTQENVAEIVRLLNEQVKESTQEDGR